MDKIDKITSERQEARAKLLGAEGRINELDRQIESLMIQSKERGKTILELTDELEKKDIGIAHFESEKNRLEERIKNILTRKEYLDFGVLVVDTPQGLSKENTDSLLNPLQERMNEQMKVIGVDIPIIIMPSGVKSFNTYMAESIKEEK